MLILIGIGVAVFMMSNRPDNEELEAINRPNIGQDVNVGNQGNNNQNLNESINTLPDWVNNLDEIENYRDDVIAWANRSGLFQELRYLHSEVNGYHNDPNGDFTLFSSVLREDIMFAISVNVQRFINESFGGLESHLTGYGEIISIQFGNEITDSIVPDFISGTDVVVNVRNHLPTGEIVNGQIAFNYIANTDYEFNSVMSEFVFTSSD